MNVEKLKDISTSDLIFQVSNKHSRSINSECTLFVTDPFDVISFSSQDYMIDGEEFTATCTIRVNNKAIKPDVYLFHGNILLKKNNNTHIEVSETANKQIMVSKVTIKKASVGNNGTYSCVAVYKFTIQAKALTTQFIYSELLIATYSFMVTSPHILYRTSRNH